MDEIELELNQGEIQLSMKNYLQFLDGQVFNGIFTHF